MLHPPPTLSALRSSTARRLLRRTPTTLIRRVSLEADNSIPDEPHESIQSIGIIGGGISGLASAWYLSKFAPDVPVTLIEKSGRLGGWIRSKKVGHERGTVRFDMGPRTLRPWSSAGLGTLDMIRQLDLQDEMVLVPKTAPAAKERYIYYPDRLNRLPSSIPTFFTSLRLPIMKGIFTSLIPEYFKPKRPATLTDESVGSFITRRFSRPLAENVVSAALHGIYAGDVDKLSMKSLFPKIWRDEEKHGSIGKGLIAREKAKPIDDVVFNDALRIPNRKFMWGLRGVVMYCFKQGMETLTKAIERDLRSSENVTIVTEAEVDKIKWDGEYFSLDSPSHFATPHKFTHLISTLPAPYTSRLLPSPVSPLSLIPLTTVLVVNLYYHSPSLLPITGFGYLLPKTVPASQNPHQALGVIFDSDVYRKFDEPGTKLTVMLGGHHWDGLSEAELREKEEKAVEMAVETLRIQVGGGFVTEEPAAVNKGLMRGCIPQYTVGHEERCIQARGELEERFGGRLAVVGSSYKGVGVSDCIRMARELAVKWAREGEGTGLEDVEKRWAVRQRVVW
ncbi:Protoporphyrinogen oxidase [Ascodesmis nigricans]|uniref:Protoporphyrinogen oxidase n=1 Tax=Ascodesmis nigricans TaxID=341454 RepID=A0A4S2MSB5_9PEZI|nr:Protoporphyrinogen oxidase [Ascodesmis nigricans]